MTDRKTDISYQDFIQNKLQKYSLRCPLYKSKLIFKYSIDYTHHTINFIKKNKHNNINNSTHNQLLSKQINIIKVFINKQIEQQQQQLSLQCYQRQHLLSQIKIKIFRYSIYIDQSGKNYSSQKNKNKQKQRKKNKNKSKISHQFILSSRIVSNQVNQQYFIELYLFKILSIDTTNMHTCIEIQTYKSTN
ncbi:hypothetical protein ABPG74_010191 [Tetrahymena malaccensis]